MSERTPAESEDRLLAFADRLRSGDPADAESVEQPETWVVFAVGACLLGLPIECVREVARTPQLTHVPGAPGSVRGVTSLRGHSIPVIDIERLLGLEPGTGEVGEHILVVDYQGRRVGLLVDRVVRLVKLPPSRIVAAPRPATDRLEAALRGTCESRGVSVSLLTTAFLSSCGDGPETAIDLESGNGSSS